MPQNGINHPGITALSQAFAINPLLRVINLNDNTFTEKGGLAMAEVRWGSRARSSPRGVRPGCCLCGLRCPPAVSSQAPSTLENVSQGSPGLLWAPL